MISREFQCPHCGQDFHIQQSTAGQAVHCPSCSQMVVVPASRSPADDVQPGLQPFAALDFLDPPGGPTFAAKRSERASLDFRENRLSGSKRARRQQRRSIAMMLVGLLILAAAVVVLSRF